MPPCLGNDSPTCFALYLLLLMRGGKNLLILLVGNAVSSEIFSRASSLLAGATSEQLADALVRRAESTVRTSEQQSHQLL